MIWVAVGGRGTLIGAALGAVLVNYAKTIFTIGLLAPYWLFVLGALFVLVTIFLPKGMLGLLPSAASPPRRAAAQRRATAPPQPLAATGRGGVRTPSWPPATVAKPREITQSLLYLDGVTRQLRRLPRAQQSVARPRATARCAPSSAPTAPARPR